MPITPTSTLSKNYQALGIDEIANDIETVFTSVNALETTVNALPAAPTTTVVNISSAQILAMGSTPIELLPAPGVDKYYSISEIVLEFTAGNILYESVDAFLYFDAPETAYISSYFIKAGNQAAIFRNSGQSINVAETAQLNGFQSSFNLPCRLSTLYNTDPTLGNGTLRAIITYTTRTFGA